MMRDRSLALAVCAGSVVCLMAAQDAKAQAFVLPIGGVAINESGQIVGRNSAGNILYRYDSHYSASGTLYTLGTFSRTAVADAINDAGQVAGDMPVANGQKAFRYDGTPGAGGVLRDLGVILGTNSFGNGINNAGMVVGATNGNNATHAFRYEGTPGAGGTMRSLGSLGGSFTNAKDINDSGQITGTSNISSGQGHAFRFVGNPGAGGVMQDLGSLGGSAWGWAINDSGQVAGYSGRTGGLSEHAFLYTGTPGIDGVMHDLGTLGGSTSRAWDISNSGVVVGSAQTASGVSHAFLYVGTPGAGGRMIDLDVWLDTNYPSIGATRTITTAYGINEQGWVVCGSVLMNVSSLIPAPGSVGVVVLAMWGCARRARR